MKPISTMTTTMPMETGSFVRVGSDNRHWDVLRVVSRTGTGPYTLTVRQLAWHEHARMWLGHAWWWISRPVRQPVAAWWWDRCDKLWCFRRGALECYCVKHAWMAFEEVVEDADIGDA